MKYALLLLFVLGASAVHLPITQQMILYGLPPANKTAPVAPLRTVVPVSANPSVKLLPQPNVTPLVNPRLLVRQRLRRYPVYIEEANTVHIHEVNQVPDQQTPAPVQHVELIYVHETPLPAQEVNQQTPVPVPEVDPLSVQQTPLPAQEVNQQTPTPAPEVDLLSVQPTTVPAQEVNQQTPTPVPEVDTLPVQQTPTPVPEVDPLSVQQTPEPVQEVNPLPEQQTPVPVEEVNSSTVSQPEVTAQEVNITPVPETVQQSINLQNVYQNPVLLLVKAPLSSEVEAIYLQLGLNSLNQQPHHIPVNIQPQHFSGIVFLPSGINNSPPLLHQIQTLRVQNIQVQPGTEFLDLIQGLNQDVPIVLVVETQEIEPLLLENLLKLGSLEFNPEGVVLVPLVQY